MTIKLLLILMTGFAYGQSPSVEKSIVSKLDHNSTGGGNGGCTTCKDSFSLGVEMMSRFMKKDFSEVQNAAPIISSMNDLYYTAFNRKVIPSDGVEMYGREALSFVKGSVVHIDGVDRTLEVDTTFIDEEKYAALNPWSKENLEVHEVLVLAGFEKDGVYVWTNELMKLFPYSKARRLSKSVRCNDVACTIDFPRTREGMHVNKDSDTHGTCKFLGFSKSLGVSTGFHLFRTLTETKWGTKYKYKYRTSEVIEKDGLVIRYVSGVLTEKYNGGLRNKYKIFSMIKCLK